MGSKSVEDTNNEIQGAENKTLMMISSDYHKSHNIKREK